MDWRRWTALEAGERIRRGEVGCVELTKQILDAVDPELNAWATLLGEQAVAQAEDAQKRIRAGEDLSPLAGVPMGLKDNICTKGVQTACGSKMLEGFAPPYSATVARRLERAGAVLVGKLNMDEFAMGGSGETSCLGPTGNPWDREKTPGGSSGGCAAAVAAGEAFYALGSDTGGSIRQPCSFCGVTGIKPTYGAVSRYGLVAFASSLDQIGPVARDVRDCAEILRIIGGADSRDGTSVAANWDFAGCWSGDVAGLTIGLPKECWGPELQEGVKIRVMEAARQLEDLGARLTEVSMPMLDYAVAAYCVIACAEASSNLARYDGIRYGHSAPEADSLEDVYILARSQGFGLEVKGRILLGTLVLSEGYSDAYYSKALQAQKLIRREFDTAFQNCDILLTPCVPTTAYALGSHAADPLQNYLGDRYTSAANLAGLPAVAAPCGFDEGLPVGMQLLGRAMDEATLVRAAHAYQLATDHHKQHPGEVGGREL